MSACLLYISTGHTQIEHNAARCICHHSGIFLPWFEEINNITSRNHTASLLDTGRIFIFLWLPHHSIRFCIMDGGAATSASDDCLNELNRNTYPPWFLRSYCRLVSDAERWTSHLPEFHRKYYAHLITQLPFPGSLS